LAKEDAARAEDSMSYDDFAEDAARPWRPPSRAGMTSLAMGGAATCRWFCA